MAKHWIGMAGLHGCMPNLSTVYETKRAAAEAGSSRSVSERESDDLVRDADRFLGLVETALGLDRHVPFQERLPSTGPSCVA